MNDNNGNGGIGELKEKILTQLVEIKKDKRPIDLKWGMIMPLQIDVNRYISLGGEEIRKVRKFLNLCR